jgi:hypothetical protein
MKYTTLGRITKAAGKPVRVFKSDGAGALIHGPTNGSATERD